MLTGKADTLSSRFHLSYNMYPWRALQPLRTLIIIRTWIVRAWIIHLDHPHSDRRLDSPAPVPLAEACLPHRPLQHTSPPLTVGFPRLAHLCTPLRSPRTPCGVGC